MHLAFWLIYVSACYPLGLAWRRNRSSSLAHALVWAIAAWLGWGAALAVAPDEPASRYVGLCLIGAAGVAVLGARRPGVGAWDFVVAGLLAVLLLPLAEGFLTGGGIRFGGVRAAFLAGTLLVACLNYLPTRLGGAALLLAIGCGLETYALLTRDGRFSPLAEGLIEAVPWAACAPRRRSPPPSSVDAPWLDFRDRYGVVWGQRLREQFNRAAAHAGLPVELGWSGLCGLAAGEPNAASEAASANILRALMKRFGAAESARVET